MELAGRDHELAAARALSYGLADGPRAVRFEGDAGPDGGGGGSGVDCAGERNYVGPFGSLEAGGDDERVRIGVESEIQDDATVDASGGTVVVGDQAFRARGATVRGRRRDEHRKQGSRPDGAEHDHGSVKGINHDPNTAVNPGRQPPTFASLPMRDRACEDARVIGDVRVADRAPSPPTPRSRRAAADEGTDVTVGAIRDMRDAVTFHALEHTSACTASSTAGRSTTAPTPTRRSAATTSRSRTAPCCSTPARQERHRRRASCRPPSCRRQRVPDGTIIVDGVTFGDVEGETPRTLTASGGCRATDRLEHRPAAVLGERHAGAQGCKLEFRTGEGAASEQPMGQAERRYRIEAASCANRDSRRLRDRRALFALRHGRLAQRVRPSRSPVAASGCGPRKWCRGRGAPRRAGLSGSGRAVATDGGRA